MSKPCDEQQRHKKRAQRRGLWAEAMARLYLRMTGRRILASNLKTPVGEIDIIARRANVLFFVEVKARRELDTAAHAIRPAQQQRIQRAAEYFLMQHPALRTCDVQFDVALVSGVFTLRYQADAWRP